jgi:hypothetical protein
MTTTTRNTPLSDPVEKALATRHCPDCYGTIFRDGPRGGISQNIECVICGSRFNVAWWQPPNPAHGPILVSAHRIPSEAEGGGVWREDLFPRVLQ